MEEYFKIPTLDNLEIKWILNSIKASKKLIIFVHGFTGSMSEAHYYCWKEYFVEKWYDVFRFNLYTDGETTRKLRDCSVTIHAQDIQTICEYFTDYQEIYLVGHSLAGPCFARVSVFPNNMKKIVFWDPAFELQVTAERCYEENGTIKHQSSGKHIEVSMEMYKEFLEDDFLAILEEQAFPKQQMFAIYADGDRHIKNKPLTDAMGIESCIIEWANHGFTQDGKYKELFEKTLEFIEN